MHAPDRDRFVVAHGSLRLILAHELGAPAQELTWTRGRHGKPELAGSWTGLRFNLSHSADLSIVAVSASRAVGVDVQHLVPGLDTMGLARRFFRPDEVAYLDGDPAGRFARLWARKEAVIKAGGGRLWRGLSLPVHGEPTMLVDYDATEGVEGAGPYRVCDIDAPHGYRAAVALAGADPFTVHIVSRADTWRAPAPRVGTI